MHLLICIVCSLERDQEIGHAALAKEVLARRAANSIGCWDVVKATVTISTSVI